MHKPKIHRNHRENHGYTVSNKRPPEYDVWASMIKRCENPNAMLYKWYGALGVKVDPTWRNSYARFISDMGPRPGVGFVLDRINTNGGYSKDNCRWADQKTQSRNRKTTRNYTMGGCTKCLKDWCAELGLKYSTVKNRLYRGLDIRTASGGVLYND